MPQLTQEHFDEAIKKLATTDDIEQIKTRLDAIEEIVSGHTGTLDGISKNTG